MRQMPVPGREETGSDVRNVRAGPDARGIPVMERDLTNIIYSMNSTAAFRHYFHYYPFMEEAGRLMPPEQQDWLPNHYEAELTAFEYKEYRKSPDLISLPSAN
jgi:hypothetical protein